MTGLWEGGNEPPSSIKAICKCSANDKSVYRCSANDKSALYRYKTASIDYSRICNRKRISEKSRRLEIQYCRRRPVDPAARSATCTSHVFVERHRDSSHHARVSTRLGRVIDNTRPHTARTAMEKMEEFERIELPSHPTYGPDLTPLDCNLFRSRAHFLREKNFLNLEAVEIGVVEFFASKTTNRYRRGIRNFAEWWLIAYTNGLRSVASDSSGPGSDVKLVLCSAWFEHLRLGKGMIRSLPPFNAAKVIDSTSTIPTQLLVSLRSACHLSCGAS
ncbi:hypothetical protein ANN_06461 [Periplaneta americana]|uniref:Uncharacterized protein n=1 Tax=Periplaneta americana TaxID=6978 RepID=A0ABQ8TFC0_PERAM|nr:hypothetical protein ANN_06461 [Periplaneta americana]